MIKRSVWVLLALLLGAVLWWLSRGGSQQGQVAVSSGDEAPEASEKSRAWSVQPLEEAGQLNSDSGNGQSDVEALHMLIRQYVVAMQKRPGPPIGDDLDLARVLQGRNPLRSPLVVGTHPAFTADGHIRDRWGTPYHIHPVSSSGYAVRSAGPDKKLFTADDFVHPKSE